MSSAPAEIFSMPHSAALLVAIPVEGRTVLVAVNLRVTRGPAGVTLEMPARMRAELRQLAEALRVLRARRVGV